ncbi:insulinase family protein [Leuconostoc koreense]|nr:insulinase family protein [Leuconostoc mesenteroides]QGM25426.1 insulinase family protein [Leuconostoc mesenteroides subsp. mesenteroides]
MKKTIINHGANLVILPTTQFKTLHIAVDFSTSVDPKHISARTLVSYLAGVSSARYKTQQQVAQKTIDLYGAHYQTDVFRIGQTHHVRFTLQVPAPTYIMGGKQLLTEAFDFLSEMIFNPLVDNHAFNERVFANEQQSLMNELASVKDDKSRYSMAKLREITYDKPGMCVSASGNEEAVANLNPSDVYQTYQNMINEDTMNIVVLGDINQQQIISLLQKWPIGPHQAKEDKEPFYRQVPRVQLREVVEHKAAINQAMLTMAYQINVEPFDDQRFAVMVMNALLGGTPLSKLFMNVREKESLAYSIYSRWQHDTGFLTIAAGLDAAKVRQTDMMIQEQIKAIQEGDFDNQTVDAIKMSLISDYLSQRDSPSSQMEVAFSRLLTRRETSEQEWIDRVRSVTADDIQNAAQKMSLQSRYILLPEV